MKLASYRVRGRESFGGVVGDGVVDLKLRLAPRYDSAIELLRTDGGLDAARAAVRGVRPDFPVSEIEWLPPILAPEKILCVGINYANRNAEFGDAETPAYPSLFFRVPGSLVGHRQPIMRPCESEQLDYEAEIALVIGRAGRRIAPADALGHVAGVTLCNEGTVRDWLRHGKFNVTPGKNFDASGSMKNRMDRSIAAIKQFLESLTKGDEFFLIRFNDRPELVTGFTQDPNEILGELSSIQPVGWTALNDAVWFGVQTMKRAKNSRRALFVLTDGGDNNSRYSDSEVRKLVQESDVRIYSIGLFERSHFLELLGMDSGGRAFSAHKLESLPQTIDKLSREFRNQYVLGYYPKEASNDGKYRRVRVEMIETIKHIPLNVFWRRGYYSPAE